MRSKTVLAKRTMSVDLEYGMFRIEEGKTYTDDGSTVFDVYVSDGLAKGWFEARTSAGRGVPQANGRASYGASPKGRAHFSSNKSSRLPTARESFGEVRPFTPS